MKRSKRFLKTVRVSLALLLSGGAAFAGNTNSPCLTSPGGKFMVCFTELEHKKFDPEQSQSIDDISHVRYKIDFRRAYEANTLAKAEYTDVYGWEKSARPAELKNIMKWFVWSPEQDFVILPAEGWASAPGTSFRKALALNPELVWETADVHMENLFWADELRVVGGVMADCHYGVDLFDGKTGKTLPLKASQAPIGYVIKSGNGRKVYIEKMLDNCASQADQHVFARECYVLNLDTMRTETVPCAGKK